MSSGGNLGHARPLVAMLFCGTMLAGVAAPAWAQDAPTAPAAAQPAAMSPTQETGEVIRSITVKGAERLEPETVETYIALRVGGIYTKQAADQALKDLFATELFSDATIRNDNGNVVIEVKENPVINRIILEGNKRIKEDKIKPEIKLQPRQIFTRSKVRADVARIIELYKRQGRFAATVEPKEVKLDQNRVDIIFEIHEGPKSKVREINIIGNHAFSASRIRGQLSTKQARFFRLFSSATGYDPDRLAYDQQKLRQFYLTQGYADFHVISAVAELTPDKRNFIITYVVEEGKRYKFGKVSLESDIRDLPAKALATSLPEHTGDWYNAKEVEDTVTKLTDTAGLLGYAFANIDPDFTPHKDTLTMDVDFHIRPTPRVYVEHVNINGNTITEDKVIRREFRVAEGDAFNSFSVKRSTDRIKSLGYFQDNLEIKQSQGSAPDRIVLSTDVEDKATGQLSLSAGYSSIENFILQASIKQTNFRGKGQELRASASYSVYSKSVDLGFTEPYLFDKPIALAFDVYRRDLNNFNLINNNRNTTYQETTTGFQIRTGVPINEFLYGAGRYTLNFDNVTLDPATYYTDSNNDGIRGNSPNDTCDPLVAGRYLCDAVGKRTTSSIGYSIVYDTHDNRLHPSHGVGISLSQDFAGLGGDVKYIKTRIAADKYMSFGRYIFSLRAEGGYIVPLQSRGLQAQGVDDIYLTDRFYLGEPQIRGFDIRGVGPRVVRTFYTPGLDASGNVINVGNTSANAQVNDSLGGRAYYLGHAELEIPLGSGVKDLGLRPSIFVDAGAVFGVTTPLVQTVYQTDTNGNPLYLTKDANGAATTTTAAIDPTTGKPNQRALSFQEQFLGDSPSPRVSIGFGVNWNSPFGPFRIDVAKALLTQPGDDTKLVTFNVGTQF